MRASGAPGSSCRREPLARRLTSYFRELEVATQKHKKLPKSQNYFMSRAGAYSTMATSPMQKRLSPNTFAVLQADVYLFLARSRTPTRFRESLYVIGPKKGQNRAKKLWILVHLIDFSESSKYGSWMSIPSSIFKSYVYVAETPTRVCLTKLFPEGICAPLMSAIKRYCRELSIEYFNLPKIGGVCEIASKEHEGPSSLLLKAPHTYTRTYVPDTKKAIIISRPGSVHDTEL